MTTDISKLKTHSSLALMCSICNLACWSEFCQVLPQISLAFAISMFESLILLSTTRFLPSRDTSHLDVVQLG